MKNLKKLGKILMKSEQKSILGGGKNKRPRCCNPADYCCTTSYLAVNNPTCHGVYVEGCLYHYATSCCI